MKARLRLLVSPSKVVNSRSRDVPEDDKVTKGDSVEVAVPSALTPSALLPGPVTVEKINDSA